MQLNLTAIKTKFKNAIFTIKILAIRKGRETIGKEVVHVIGDSHALAFQSPLFKIHYIGSATAYMLGAENSSTGSRKKIISILNGINPRASVLMVFGEIDARIQIFSAHKEKKISLRTAVNQTVDRYLVFINELREIFPQMKFLILCVLPQGEQGNYFKKKHYATREQRIKITELLNSELKLSAEDKSIPFIDIYNHLINTDKSRIDTYVFDEIHFNNSIIPFITCELKNKKII